MKAIFTFLMAVLMTSGVLAQNNMLNFNGTSDYVDLGAVDYGFTNQLTIMAWVKWNVDPSTGNKWANIISNNQTNKSDRGQFWIQHNSNNSKFEFAMDAGSNRNFIVSSTQPQQGVWYHVAAVYTGSQMQLFVNGVLESSKSKSGNVKDFNSDMQTHVAGWANPGGNQRRFTGSIDDLSIWTKALSATEIITIMNDASSINNADGDLGLNLDFDQNNGGFLNDLSGNVTSITIEGIPVIEPSTTPSTDGSTLPIELTSFEAFEKDRQVMICWKTASEINNDYFTIEKSENGIDFYPLDLIKSFHSNSSEAKVYLCIDNNFNQSTYYRLSQTDFDGKTEVFDAVFVEKESKVDFKIYPNPVRQQSYVNIELENTATTDVEIVIRNMQGQVLRIYQIDSGMYNQQLYLDQLSKGMYLLQMQSGDRIISKKLEVL